MVIPIRIVGKAGLRKSAMNGANDLGGQPRRKEVLGTKKMLRSDDNEWKSDQLNDCSGSQCHSGRAVGGSWSIASHEVYMMVVLQWLEPCRRRP